MKRIIKLNESDIRRMAKNAMSYLVNESKWDDYDKAEAYRDGYDSFLNTKDAAHNYSKFPRYSKEGSGEKDYNDLSNGTDRHKLAKENHKFRVAKEILNHGLSDNEIKHILEKKFGNKGLRDAQITSITKKRDGDFGIKFNAMDDEYYKTMIVFGDYEGDIDFDCNNIYTTNKNKWYEQEYFTHGNKENEFESQIYIPVSLMREIKGF